MGLSTQPISITGNPATHETTSARCYTSQRGGGDPGTSQVKAFCGRDALLRVRRPSWCEKWFRERRSLSVSPIAFQCDLAKKSTLERILVLGQTQRVVDAFADIRRNLLGEQTYTVTTPTKKFR
jgi:hypothetical protein